MNKISKDINLVKSVLFSEESEEYIIVDFTKPNEVESALKKLNWIKVTDDPFKGDKTTKTKWAYKPNNDSDLLVACINAYVPSDGVNPGYWDGWGAEIFKFDKDFDMYFEWHDYKYIRENKGKKLLGHKITKDNVRRYYV